MRGVCVLQALKITVRASLAFIFEKSRFSHCRSSLAPGIHFSTDVLQGGHGALAQLGYFHSRWVLRDLTPHKAPDPGSQHGSMRRAQQLVPWPSSLLISVMSSLKSAADENIENIFLLCLCQPRMPIIQQESQSSWFGLDR